MYIAKAGQGSPFRNPSDKHNSSSANSCADALMRS